MAEVKLIHVDNTGLYIEHDPDTADVLLRSIGLKGNLGKINDIPYSWPASQGALNTLLRNDGNGNLTWVNANHVSNHRTGGVDAIGLATASQEGLASAAQITKLDGIEALADVTDAANVAAAGAVMNSTSTAGINFVIDEDDLASNSPTKLPTQKNVKAYVDGRIVGLYSHRGGYNAGTNTPNLTSSPVGVLKGYSYTVTLSGTFFSENVEPGDLLIADQDNPTLLTHWTRVNKNFSFGTTAGTACAGDDSRLSDARTPVSHAATHLTSGSDAIQLATNAQPGLASAAHITSLEGKFDIAGGTVTGQTTFSNTNASVSPGTGTVVINNGLGVGGDAFLGGNIGQIRGVAYTWPNTQGAQYSILRRSDDNGTLENYEPIEEWVTVTPTFNSAGLKGQKHRNGTDLWLHDGIQWFKTTVVIA